MSRKIFCERWYDLPLGERVIMASCGGKNNVSRFRGGPHLVSHASQS